MAVEAWTQNPYPPSRKNRRSAIGQPDDAGNFVPSVRTPRTYIWALALGEGPGEGVTRVCSKRLRGPVVIKSFYGEWNLQSDAGDDFPFIAIYYTLAPFANGSNLPRTPQPGANYINDTTFQRETLFNSAPDWPAFLLGSGKVAITRYEMPLNYYINLPECYLGVDFVNMLNAGGSDLGANVLIYEDVDPSMVPALIGG